MIPDGVMVIGSGRLGTLIGMRCQRVTRRCSGRAFLTMLKAPEQIRTLVYAAGAAGDRRCLADPELALRLHVTGVQHALDWLHDTWVEQVILLGTLAPLVGFYGPLKQLSMDYAWVRTLPHESLTILELGQVIGSGVPIGEGNDGVIAKALATGLGKGTIQILGDGTQLIRVTPLSDLIGIIDLLSSATGIRRILAPVSQGFPVSAIIQTLARLGAPCQSVLDPTLPQVSYRDPTCDVIPVTPLAKTLQEWIQSVKKSEL